MSVLSGLRVVEFAGIGPGPFAAMLLADMGADVVRIERPAAARAAHDITLRGRRVVTLDLKRDAAAAMDLLERADALIEGFRPGVMERLGLGPEAVAARNPRLVYGRMTGWGQSGPLADRAGHDITYLALTGALHAIGAKAAPVPPLNLVGDYGGGALYLVVGMLAAILSARQTGLGQVVDAAITDGVTSLLSLFHGMLNGGQWRDVREANLLDGGAHFYATYECADGKFIAVGAIEPQFYAELRRLAGLTDPLFDDQRNPAIWPLLKQKFADLFRTRTRDAWAALFAGSDACVAPVLSLAEARADPHLLARGTFVGGEPAPAPRFSRTRSVAGEAPVGVGVNAVLAGWA
jgi:alpha-methylacyl-CoA racemase